MMIKALLASLLPSMVQPGGSAFSVEVAADCAGQQSCAGAKWSTFYGAWVRRESEATARRRFNEMAEVIDEQARLALCLDAVGNVTCAQSKAQRKWTLDELVSMTAGIAIAESGLREDVMVGRGWAKKASPDGGMGRGPGMEACAMQIHPTVAKPEPLLGTDRAALSRCFAQGIGMLVHARQWCSGKHPRLTWDYKTVSLYATGASCASPNNGKTEVRVRYARQILAGMRKAKS